MNKGNAQCNPSDADQKLLLAKYTISKLSNPYKKKTRNLNSLYAWHKQNQYKFVGIKQLV